MVQHLHRVVAFVRAHRVAFGLGGGAVAVGTVVALVKRGRAAAVGERIVERVRSILGAPYVWGSNDPSRGVDCSGTVVYALRSLGLKSKGWDASVAQLWKESSRVVFPQPGDLVFYGGGIISDPTHVMVYQGDGKVVGATGGGPATATPAAARARGAEVKVVDIDYRKDRRGIGRLPLGEVRETAAVGSLHMLGGV